MAWEIAARERGPDGTEFVLYRFDDQFMIRAGGWELMSSRAHGSEEALARLGCDHLLRSRAPRVLIGGLGLGYTVRAALDCLSEDAVLIVAELVPAIVDWNRGAAGACSGWPLHDPRVTVHVGDVATHLEKAVATYDAVLLDVDNGPEALSWEGNGSLYGDAGCAVIRAALRPGGTLAVWSSEVEPLYAENLRRAGFSVRHEQVPARGEWCSSRHVIYLAKPEALSMEVVSQHV